MNNSKKTQILRITLLIGAVFNLIASLMLAFPATIGRLGELPEPGSIFYSSLLSFVVGTFGVIYGWLAFQKVIDRPLLTVSAVGKIGVFLVSLYCWSVDAITFRAFSVAIGDLIFGLIFFWWLMTETKR